MKPANVIRKSGHEAVAGPLDTSWGLSKTEGARERDTGEAGTQYLSYRLPVPAQLVDATLAWSLLAGV
jgi:hypothetical protein